MDKIDILFVRACKSNSSIVRINKLHKRFYCLSRRSPENKAAIIGILSDIIEASNPMKTLDGVQLAMDLKNVNVVDLEDKIIEKLVTRIALTKASSFDGFIPPRMFRK